MLEKENCRGTYPTFFTVNLTGLGEHRLDINQTHIDDRGGLFFIHLTDTVSSINHLNGTITGGNEAGNCTAYPIQHSNGENKFHCLADARSIFPYPAARCSCCNTPLSKCSLLIKCIYLWLMAFAESTTMHM